jgi:serine/threonine-protein kinase
LISSKTSPPTIYYASKPGVYLPLGYRPDDGNDLDGLWPKALVRISDDAKFIRITGGRFIQGDFREQGQVQELRPHEVEVSSFYIQETEVTNGEILDRKSEIQEYQGRNPLVSLGAWEQSYKLLTEDNTRPKEVILRCPAASINRVAAEKYAELVGGRLPTESEWEYAARSGGKLYVWAGMDMEAKQECPKAGLFKSIPELFPSPVKNSEGEDETDQKVYDMTGSLREWCLDEYRDYPKNGAGTKKTDRPPLDPRVGEEPTTANPEIRYVVRGGSFQLTPEEAMTFVRGRELADEDIRDLGFRVVIHCPRRVEETKN